MTRQKPEGLQHHQMAGMCNFERHRHPKFKRISPSDLDQVFSVEDGADAASVSSFSAIYDARVGARRFIVEYKTLHEDIEKRYPKLDRLAAMEKLMGGQYETLESFTRVPNQQAIIAFDPYWNDYSNTRMDMTVPLSLYIVRRGRLSKRINTTIGGFSEGMYQWQWGRGAFADTVFNYGEELAKLRAVNASDEDILTALGLPGGRRI